MATASRYGVTAFALPQYNPPGAFEGSDASATEAKPYAIPPVVWMFILGFIGWVGLRMVIQD